LSEELEAFASLQTSRDLQIDVRALIDDLNGDCESPLDMFSSIVRHLAGDAELYGEKSTDHLLWWRPLTQALSRLKVVVAVRDPRAVVASNLDVSWGMDSHILLAERWADEQRRVTEARNTLGEARCLVLRYEDVVTDARRARVTLAGFLGVDRAGDKTGSNEGTAGSSLYLPWETWKSRTGADITAERIDAWRDSLTRTQEADVKAICGREMSRFGYSGDASNVTERVRLVRLSPATQWRRLHFHVARRRRLAEIDNSKIK
jgi:hypothetical protein